MLQLQFSMKSRVKEQKRSLIVVLNGFNVLSEETAGLNPLLEAMGHFELNSNLEILVMVILSMDTNSSLLQLSPAPSGSNTVFCCLGNGQRIKQPNMVSSQGNDHVESMHREIRERRKAFFTIFTPYHRTCKSKGAKFKVKIAAGCELQDTIEEEAHRAQATDIFVDSCFARDLRFRVKGIECGVSLVNENVTASVPIFTSNESELQTVNDASVGNDSEPLQSVNTDNCSHSSNLHRTVNISRKTKSNETSLVAELSYEKEAILRESKKSLTMTNCSNRFDKVHTETTTEGSLGDEYTSSELPNDNPMLHQPLQLSFPELEFITNSFKTTWKHMDHCTIYSGQMNVRSYQSAVLVHKLQGHCIKILKAEKKVSSTMYHKNILRLVGYHQSENTTFLVYPYAKHTLDSYLFGSTRKLIEPTFQTKMKIAIETAQAIRYMHEEYPRGPVAHCNIIPCNIYIGQDFRPQVSGFKQAKWLHHEQASLNSNGRSIDPSECEVLSIMKADIYSFGVLLLRVFCQRPVPRDDKKLIEWARPLMIQRNFCEVLGAGAEKLDTHTVYKVMCIATRCTATRPILRPSMSEVVWTLKGEIFCEFQLSPSEGSEKSD